jgi:diaminopimelate epimerase
MILKFTKLVGAGNDFIVVDNRLQILKKNLATLAKRWCDRKHSIGADGLILLEKSKKAQVRMRIFNPDSSEAEMCGNGVRCLAKFAADRKITPERFKVETIAGIIGVEVRGQTVKARLVDPKDFQPDLSVTAGGQSHRLHFVNTGVPHAVKLVDSVERCDVRGLGSQIRFHGHFAPRGTNVNFVCPGADNSIKIRTYERGVEDETLACGTGSTAGALVSAALKGFKSPVRVYTRGGEVLKVYFSKNSKGFTDVFLEGRIDEVFEGSVKL